MKGVFFAIAATILLALFVLISWENGAPRRRFFTAETHKQFLDPSNPGNRIRGAGLDLDEQMVGALLRSVEQKDKVFLERWPIAGCSLTESELNCGDKGFSANRCGVAGDLMFFEVSYPFSGSIRGIHIGDPIQSAWQAGFIDKDHKDTWMEKHKQAYPHVAIPDARGQLVASFEIGDFIRRGDYTCQITRKDAQ